MTESEDSQSRSSPPYPKPRPRRRWLWWALVCAATLGWLAYRNWPDPQPPKPPAASPQPEPPTGPELAISVWADAQPVSGARVSVHGVDCQERSHTDEEGLVKLYGCGAGPFEASIEAPGYVRMDGSWVLDAAGSLERVDLEPAEPLEGQVLDESGQPLPGVTITARLLGPTQAGADARAANKPWLALTGNDGTFVIKTLPAGPIVVDVSDGGAHEPLSLTDVTLPCEPLEIALRRTAAMSGKVVTADEQPVAGAEVTLAGSGVWPARVTLSDPTGAFSFPHVPEGVYELRAEHDTSVSAPLEGIVVEPGNHATIELVLSPGATLRGRVNAASSGEPLQAELRVVEEALSARQRAVRSDADGRFEVSGLRALPHRVTTESEGYVSDQRWLTPGQPVVIELLRAAAASGRVLDSDGNPVPHADIEVKGRSVTGRTVLMVGPIQEAPPLVEPTARVAAANGGGNLGVTSGAIPRLPIVPLPEGVGQGDELGYHSDADGRFSIEGLPPGQFTLTARKAGMSAGHSAPLQLKAATTLEDVSIVLPAGVSIRGRVLDARGDAVAHVRVDLVSGGDLPRSTTTLADGSFVFDSARGECTLWARPFGAPASQLSGSAQELAEEPVVLTLESNSDRLEGRVVDESGQPIASASVRLEVVDSHGYAPTVLSAQDGSFEFSALPPPPYALSAEHPEFSPSSPLSVDSTRDSVEIQLLRGAELRGRVTDAIADAPPRAAEVLVRAGAATRSLRVGRDGSFALRHLPEGPYRLTATADGYVSETVEGQLDSAHGAATVVHVELVKAASISGEVVDRLGRTVWNAQVAAGSPPDWARATRTDHAGHFRLRGVSEGEHSVSARHGALQASTDAPLRVVEGEDTPGAIIRLPGVVDDEIARAQRDRSADHATGKPLAFGMRGASVVVEHVAPDTQAARAGLREGDVLLSVNGERVRSAAQARGMLAFIPGRRPSWTLQVRREQRVVKLRYGAR